MFQIQSSHVEVGNPVGKRNKTKKKVRPAVFPVLSPTSSVRIRQEDFESRTTRSARGGGRIAIAWSARRSRLLGFLGLGRVEARATGALVLYTLVICDRSDGDDETT